MPFLTRRHLFEFNDQAWLPPLLRESFNDTLALLHKLFGPYGQTAPALSDWLNQPDPPREVLDLASAGGEHIVTVLSAATQHGLAMPRFILSDLYPAVETWQRVQAEVGIDRCGHVVKPVDALAVPADLPSYRTIFTAFHHLPAPMARKFIEHFVATGNGLCIAEYFRRDLYNLVMGMLTFPICMLAPLFARKVTLGKILVGTVIPIVPLMVLVDGIVSTLRTYGEKEILDMIPEHARGDFDVRIVSVWHQRAPMKSQLTFITRIVQPGRSHITPSSVSIASSGRSSGPERSSGKKP